MDYQPGEIQLFLSYFQNYGLFQPTMTGLVPLPLKKTQKKLCTII